MTISIVAYFPSKPILLPIRNLFNSALLHDRSSSKCLASCSRMLSGGRSCAGTYQLDGDRLTSTLAI